MVNILIKYNVSSYTNIVENTPQSHRGNINATYE